MTEPYSWYAENILNKIPEKDRVGDNDFDVPPFYRDSPEMRKHLARVYNSIQLADTRIGELLARLEADNLKDSTIIFCFADHGEGEPRGKTNGINLGYRVPFVIWFPEMYKHLSPWGTSGIVTDELIDFNDLAPTLISLAGGEVPDHLTGRVLIGENRSKVNDHLVLSVDRSDNGIDMVRSVTNGKYIYSRNFMPFMPEVKFIRYMEIAEIKQQMRKDLTENRLDSLQRTIFNDRPAEFLFDIENDIWETKNLTSDPVYKEVLTKMRQQLKREMLNERDVMLLPEYEIGLISEKTTPYEYRLNDKDFPVDEIFKAASLSGFRGKDIAAKQAKLLGNSNKIVRYWAILGLRSQNVKCLESHKSEIIKAMSDGYLPVAVSASAIAYNVFNNSTAEENLKQFCANSNMDIALMAVNFLLYIDKKEPFVDTIKNVHDMPGRNYNVKAACMDFLGSMGLVPNNPQFSE
jgi:hypothetical protein